MGLIGTMQVSNSFKEVLLKHMLVGLHAESSSASSKNSSFLERKRAIKLTADVATAFTRGNGANWSRTVISELAGQEKDKNFVMKSRRAVACKLVRSKKIVRRSLRTRRRGCLKKKVMVMNRIGVLKRLVPGAELLGDNYFALLGEALDYVVSLQVQVDVMKRLSNAVERSNNSNLLLSGR